MAQPTVPDSPGPADTQEYSVAGDDTQQQDAFPAEPASKRLRLDTPTASTEVVPKQFSAKWIATRKGILPFVKNLDTGLVHCGFTKMKVIYFKSDMGLDDYTSVVCLSGCIDCPRDGITDCECVCHLLQRDYDSRPAH